LTKPTERCLDAAGIPFVDEHLPSAQLPRGAGCTIEVAREDAANEPKKGSIGNLNGLRYNREVVFFSAVALRKLHGICSTRSTALLWRPANASFVQKIFHVTK
jgi:hypothetical protein